MKVICIGEILWDVFGDAEHLGGACFNLAAHAARLGHDVTFVSAVSDDKRGQRALSRMADLGLSTRFARTVRGVETGIVTVILDSGGQPDFVIHRPAAYDHLKLDGNDLDELARMKADWICYGTLFQIDPNGRACTRELVSATHGARRFYDLNLRQRSYTPELVRELLASSDVVKLNNSEAAELQRMLGGLYPSEEAFCRSLAKQYGLQAVCVTRGEAGCAILAGDSWAEVDGCPVVVADAVGAGDAFSAAFLHGMQAGWPPAEVGRFANRVGAIVASRRGAIPEWTMEEVLR